MIVSCSAEAQYKTKAFMDVTLLMTELDYEEFCLAERSRRLVTVTKLVLVPSILA